VVYDTVHVATTIERPADDVYAFVTNPANLPQWAAGLASGEVTQVGEQLVVDSPMGRVTVRFAPPNPFGIADHEVTLPSGEAVANPFRIIANGDGCDAVFTVRRRPGMSAAEHAADVDAVHADLARLRELLERA
jgi:hypothetical protein